MEQSVTINADAPAHSPAARESVSDLVLRIPVKISIILGSARLSVAELMQLKPGATIELDRKIGDPVDIEVNGKIVASGEIVVIDPDTTRLGVKIVSVFAPDAAGD